MNTRAIPDNLTERILFETAALARTNRMECQSREQFSDEYRRKKTYYWTRENALIEVIEKCGLMEEYQAFEDRNPSGGFPDRDGRRAAGACAVRMAHAEDILKRIMGKDKRLK